MESKAYQVWECVENKHGDLCMIHEVLPNGDLMVKKVSGLRVLPHEPFLLKKEDIAEK